MNGSANTPGHIFTRVVDIATDEAGRIYLLDFGEPALQVFGNDGRRLATIGRGGGGPGEFLAPVEVGWRADTLWVLDVRTRRLTLFDRLGDLITTVEFSLPSGKDRWGPLVPGPMLADGSLLSLPQTPASLMADGSVSQLPCVRVSRNGSVIDTLAWYSTARRHAQILRGASGSRTILREPFSDAPIVAPDAAGAHVILVERTVESGRQEPQFRVIEVHVDGDTAYDRRYNYEPIQLSRARRNSVLDEETTGADSEAFRRELEDAFFWPAHLPPVTAFATDDRGRLFLRREDDGGPVTRWDIHDAYGDPIGSFVAPRELRILHVDKDLVWGEEVGALDVPSVVSYRLTHRDISAPRSETAAYFPFH